MTFDLECDVASNYGLQRKHREMWQSRLIHVTRLHNVLVLEHWQRKEQFHGTIFEMPCTWSLKWVQLGASCTRSALETGRPSVWQFAMRMRLVCLTSLQAANTNQFIDMKLYTKCLWANGEDCSGGFHLLVQMETVCTLDKNVVLFHSSKLLYQCILWERLKHKQPSCGKTVSAVIKFRPKRLFKTGDTFIIKFLLKAKLTADAQSIMFLYAVFFNMIRMTFQIF